FGPSTVNRHQIELFVLDRSGRIGVTFQRAQWEVDRVVDEAVALLDKRKQHRMSGLRIVGRLCGVLILALVPKCPLCWWAYVSAGGLGALSCLAVSQAARGILVGVIVLDAVAVCAGLVVRRSRSLPRLTTEAQGARSVFNSAEMAPDAARRDLPSYESVV